MATNLADDDLIEMRVACVLNDQLGINVYHFVCGNRTPVAGEVTTADAAVHLSAVYDGLYASVMSNLASFYGVGVRRLTPTLTLEDGWAGNQTAGGQGSAPLPPQSCGVITFLTGLGGRSGRGRRYLPFPAVGSVGALGGVHATYVTDAQALADEYMAGATITGSGGTTIDISPVLKHLDLTFDPITSYIVRTKWGTQKSRGNYGRPNAPPSWPS